ncbi:ester cyclase [Haloarcula onubensis]|uniref:Ester cyclase n=1 Tax=Haloarcula onubensis TaxID=2950539 RepID=A0ABU2FPY1_9EURY|nr:ester cyclase [Halomicroarcula sp. S3CR25-11]MDS0282322.1 ester cyclase [Halomicroarcula sp. S3CR25-11]
MTESENKDLVRDYLRAFNEQDREQLSELLAEGVVEYGSHEERRESEAITAYLEALFETFPDYSGNTDEMVAEDDLVVVRYTASGTHEGEYQDVEPTGNNVEWTGMGMYRIEDDEIAEIWLEEDRAGLLEQLEVASPPAHLRI